MKLISRAITVILCLGLLTWAFPAFADPPTVFLIDRQINASVETCVGISAQAMRKMNLQNIQTQDYIAQGETSDENISVACSDLGKGKVMHIVVFAGQDLNKVNQLVKQFKQSIP